MADIEGFKELEKSLKNYGEETEKKAVRCLRAGADAIQLKARQTVAVDTGALRESIVKIEKLKGNTFSISIGSTLLYAGAIEFGALPHANEAGHDEFIKRLKVWCRRHNMPFWPVYKKIVKKGSKDKPRPFLIPAYNQVEPKVMAKLEIILNEGLK
jgi:HK97 gp10 family phage protein